MNYFYNYLKSLNKSICIFIDMDGVVADYDAVSYLKDKETIDVYKNKRPIKTTISILEKISTLEHVELNILSCTRNKNQIDGKIKWLEEYMSFIKKERINIISREEKNFAKAKDIKRDFLKEKENDSFIILIDDSHEVIDEILRLNSNILPLHISSILD
ncbi:MAG: hypothetical protein IJ568_06130 [Bacilli bacterium]|nr:hypothetical protein [Bacilli bacterium]